MMDNELDRAEESITESYKCPECGAPMHFDPSTNSLKCDYCQKSILLPGESSNDEFSFDDLDTTTLDSSWQNEKQVVKCKECGASNVVSKKEISVTCPFCASTNVVSSSTVPGIKPQRVIPFRVEKDVAVKGYGEWLKKRFFAPNKVKREVPNLTSRGVYIPSWTYDATTFSSYKGRLGKHYTRTVGTGKNKHTVTETRYFTVKGVIDDAFDDVLVQAGEKISQNSLAKIEPFDTNNAKVFDERFLAGFMAEHYHKNVNEAWPTAKSIMEEHIKSKILSRYNYDVVDYLNIKTEYSNRTYKYVLLPIWLGNYKYNNKEYRYIVNGENGRFEGTYPKSAVKIGIVVTLAVILLVALIYFFVMYE